MDDIRKWLETDIKGINLGEAYLGMGIVDFRKQFVKSEYHYRDAVLKMSTFFPDCVSYTYFDCIKFMFKLNERPVLNSIYFSKGYEGKVLGNIAIGDCLSRLKEKNIPLQFDDDLAYIFLDDMDIVLTADDDISLFDSLDEIYNSKIENIRIELPIPHKGRITWNSRSHDK